MATMEQVAQGVARFLRESVAPKVTDDPALKVGVLFLAKRMQRDPGALTLPPALASVLGATDDGIDVDEVAGDLAEVVEAAGGLPVELPAIPLVSPQGHTLTFTGADVRDLARMIEDAR